MNNTFMWVMPSKSNFPVYPRRGIFYIFTLWVLCREGFDFGGISHVNEGLFTVNINLANSDNFDHCSEGFHSVSM